MAEWFEKLTRPTAGRVSTASTVEAVASVLSQWLDRRYGILTFRLTQVLSEHGCFGHTCVAFSGKIRTTVQ